MSKIIVTGATGNAGSAVLNAALASPQVAHVTVIGRRPPFVTHEKLSTILLPSAEYPGGFDNIPQSVIDLVNDHRAVIWAQGISQTQVSKEEYIKITHDYPLAAVEAFKGLGTASDPFRFIYMSGEGANQNEKGYQLFSRIKGKTEKEIKAKETESFQTLSVRPGGILPTSEHAPRMSWGARLFFQGVAGALGAVAPSYVIKADKLGEVCVALAVGNGGWENRTEQGWVNNAALRRLSGEL